jgi:chemotaxis protein CheZ
MAQDVEAQLLQLLLENCPPERREAAHSLGLLGPVIGGSGRSDVMTNQGQVDELLESLGF